MAKLLDPILVSVKVEIDETSAQRQKEFFEILGKAFIKKLNSENKKINTTH